MAPKRLLLAPLLTCTLAACAAERVTTIDDTIIPGQLEVWSGGVVDLYSRAFVGRDTLPVVLFGAETLAVAPRDTFVVRVQLPDTVAGLLPLDVRLADGVARPAVAVTAHGFAGWRAGPDLAGLPQRTPDGAMLAVGDGGTVRVLPWAGTAESLTPQPLADTACTLTPGLSLVPGVVISSGRNGRAFTDPCRYYAWNTTGTASVVDSAPYGSAFSAAYLGPGRWLINTKHNTWAIVGGVTTDLGQLEEPDEFVADSAGRFLVPNLTADFAGVPVYATATASIAYRVAGQRGIGGVGFSRGGDTLFVAGAQMVVGGGPARLLALDARDGHVLREAPLEGFGGGYMVVEPERPWIYLVDGLRVLVVDRRTLAVVARMRPPEAAPALISWDDVLVPLLGPGNRLYVVDVHAWRDAPKPTGVYEFALLP